MVAVPQNVGVSKDGRGLWVIHRDGAYQILAERWGRTALVGTPEGYPTQRDAIFAASAL